MDSKPSPGAPTPAPSRGKERRSGKDRREKGGVPPQGAIEKRRAERRSGLDRRRPHLHYEDLTLHPRPERNINDYPLSTDEVEFINAINDYKSKFDRPFPTWSEILHVLRTLGYIRFGEEFPVPAEGGPFDPPPGDPPPAPPDGEGSSAPGGPAPGATPGATPGANPGGGAGGTGG